MPYRQRFKENTNNNKNVPFNRISVISGQSEVDNERLCAIDPCLRLERFPPLTGLKPGTAGSVGQHLTYLATGPLTNTVEHITVELQWPEY